MKPIISVHRFHITGSRAGDSLSPGEGEPTPRFSVADRIAFVVLAVGLLALGGVLLAAGLALLLALAAGGAVIGAVALARHRIRGGPRRGLAPGEIRADASILPPSDTPALSSDTLEPRTAPRAD